MQKTWTNKNVDLTLLSEAIEQFFKDKGYITKKMDSEERTRIIFNMPRTPKGLRDRMRVDITGYPNDFTVDVVASELTLESIRLGLFTKFIGGGYIALKNIRLKEELEKMENDFWTFTEEKVSRLSESTRNQ